MGAYLFISDASADDHFVRELHKACRDRRWDILVDSRQLRGENPPWTEVQWAISRAAAFAVVVSPDGLQSEWAEKELRYALEVQERHGEDRFWIVAILLDGTKRAVLERLFGKGPVPIAVCSPAGEGEVAVHAFLEALEQQLFTQLLNASFSLTPAGPEALRAAPSVPQAIDSLVAQALPLEAPGAEHVGAAVFCPPTVRRASPFLVQVFLYPPGQAEVARAEAREADIGAERRGVLPLDLPHGTRIELRLEMPGLQVDEPDAALVWHGLLAAAQFDVAVPKFAPLGTAIGRIRFSIAGVPAGTLRFQIAVASVPRNRVTRAVDVAVRRYRRAFISYSSEDRAEVLRRVQAFRIAGLSVFQDVLDLEPGDRWESEMYRQIDDCDVVMLFWSRAAAASPWVAKEIDYALARKQGQEDLPPDIEPVPIEGPPIPTPPEKLRHLHFNDALLAHIAAAQGARTD